MKDTYYFSHDYNTREDEKIKNLIFKHGWAGYGIFWALIEMLYQNDGYMQTHYERIAFDLRSDKDVVTSIINDFNLFELHEEMFFSKSVLHRIKKMRGKSLTAKKAAKIRWDKAKADDANAMQTHCGRNAIKESKVNETKLKESKVKRKKVSVDKSPDFINQILSIFQDEYLKSRNQQFELVTPGKERSAIGKLLKIHKDKNPDKSSAETLSDFRDMFRILLNIREKWDYEKMSPAHIAANFNQLRSKLTPKPESKLDIDAIISKL